MADPRPVPTRQQQADWLAEAARLHPAERFSLIAEHVGRLAYAAGLEAGRRSAEPSPENIDA